MEEPLPDELADNDTHCVSAAQQGRISGSTRAYRRRNKGVSTAQQGGIEGCADTALLIRPYQGIDSILPRYCLNLPRPRLGVTKVGHSIAIQRHCVKSDTLPQASNGRDRGKRQEPVMRCSATRTAFSKTSAAIMFRGGVMIDESRKRLYESLLSPASTRSCWKPAAYHPNPQGEPRSGR